MKKNILARILAFAARPTTSVDHIEPACGNTTKRIAELEALLEGRVNLLELLKKDNTSQKEQIKGLINDLVKASNAETLLRAGTAGLTERNHKLEMSALTMTRTLESMSIAMGNQHQYMETVCDHAPVLVYGSNPTPNQLKNIHVCRRCGVDVKWEGKYVATGRE
jgi:hypothetical protein